MASILLNPITDEYSYLSPTGGLIVVDREEEDRRIVAEIATLSAALVALGALLNSGEIDAIQFQRRAADLLRQIHILNAVLGSGGWHNLDQDGVRAIEQEVQRQIDGRSPNGDRYGLRYLAALVLAGGISLAMLQARLGMYAASGKISYWAAFQRSHRGVLAKRELGLSAKHCQCCIDHANLPPMPIEEIHPIGACECLSNCKCSIEILEGRDRWRALTPEEE